ncbi:MAG: hypothetical protein WC912_06950 [Thermovirgaceae bacterium]|jgi:hypothetical protein
MIANTDMFNTYSGNYEDSPEALMLKEAFLTSAEEIVVSYLGFRPTLQAHTDVLLSGSGNHRLYLPAHNITTLEGITIGCAALEPDLFVLCDDHIRFRDNRSTFPTGKDNILTSYTAGWAREQMPSVITLSILRIATLMLSETGGNIGLTGKSFADNSRTFINYSNYRKYLQPLDGLRIMRF